MGTLARSGSLALFTESVMCLLSSPTAHGAMVDLVSLMGQTFPQAAPSLYVTAGGSKTQVYSVLDREQGGTADSDGVRIVVNPPRSVASANRATRQATTGTGSRASPSQSPPPLTVR